jgi:hypothetical protein
MLLRATLAEVLQFADDDVFRRGDDHGFTAILHAARLAEGHGM